MNKHLDETFARFASEGGTNLTDVLNAAEKDGCDVRRPKAEVLPENPSAELYRVWAESSEHFEVSR